jgi:hypothetical protein
MAGDLPDLVAQVLTELGPTGRSDRSRPTNGVVRTLG